LLSLTLTGCFEPSATDQLAEAKARLAKGDVAAADVLLKASLQQDPKSGEARFLLARNLLQAGSLAEAEIELNKAVAAGYDKEQVTPLLAESLVRRGQFDKVISGYKETQLKQPKQQSALLVNVAKAYIGLQKYDAAKAAADQALKLDTDSLDALLVDAQLKSLGRQYEPALAQVEQAISRWPASAEAWELKAAILQVGNAGADRVVAAFEEAVKRNPRSVTALSALVSMHLAKKDFPAARKTVDAMRKALPNDLQTIYAQAMLAMAERDLKRAAEFAEQLRKIAPESSRVLHLAGAIDFERGSYLRAEAALGRVLQSHPDAHSVRVLLTRTYLGMGEADKAMQTLQPLLTANVSNVEVLTLAGQVALAQSKPAAAEKYFTRAVAANPGDFRGRTALAVARLEQGREDQGVADLLQIAAEDAEPRADMELIGAFLKRRDFARAEKALEVLDKKAPKGVEAPMMRAQLELARGNVAQARAAWESALARRPSYLPAAQALAELDIKDKKADQAAARLQALIKADPKNVQGHLALIGVRRQMGLSAADEKSAVEELVKMFPEEPTPRLALADYFLAQKDYKSAAAVASEGAAKFSDEARFYRLLGQAQFASGDLNQAKQSFQKEATLQPRSPQPHMSLSNIAMAQRDAPGAIANLKRAVEANPAYAPAHAALVGMLAGAGRLDEARAEMNIVRKLEPTSPQSWVLEGNLLALQKNWSGAATAYAKALSMRPDGDVAVRLYSAYQAGGRMNEATKFEAEWLAAHPHDLLLQTYLGDNALRRKDLDQAAARYQDALKGSPDLPLLLNNLAWVYQLQGKPQAIELAQKAVKQAPNVPSFLDTLARSYAANKQFEQAVTTQTQLLALAPNQPEHRLQMATYQIQAGNKEAAREHLKALAALGRKFADQAEVQRLFQSL